MQLNEIEKLANGLIASLQIILKENEEKKQEIRTQIEKRTMQLFDYLFLNQVKLIEINETKEKSLSLKSNQLINKLKQLIQKHTTTTRAESETENIIEQIDKIKQETKNLQYNYYLETDETLENILSIGELVIFLLYLYFS